MVGLLIGGVVLMLAIGPVSILAGARYMSAEDLEWLLNHENSDLFERCMARLILWFKR